MEFTLEFDGEFLVPSINLVAYRHIYVIEGWLRRICLAAWMGQFGDNWTDFIDPPLYKTLQSRTTQNRQRVYLGAESQNDLIWQATHGELVRLLVAEDISRSVSALTGAESDFLTRKMDELRQIRNILAHNRALSQRTYVVLEGLLASLEEVVDSFKSNLLYSNSKIVSSKDNDDLGSYFYDLLAKNDWSRFQAFAARSGDFIQLTSLPVVRDARWPSAKLLLKVFESHLDKIVVFCLNKEADEFTIVAPSILDRVSQEALCNTFANNSNVWTSVPYERQSARFICSPKIWFYENQRPDNDANSWDFPPF